MSVRQRKWKDPRTGAEKEAWVVDVKFEHASGKVERVRKASPVNTRRGAEQYERQIREELLAGSYGKVEVAPAAVPTLADFAPRFMEGYAEANAQKPSSIISKASILRVHLVPAFGGLRLDQIGTEDVQRFKAKLLASGGRPRSPEEEDEEDAWKAEEEGRSPKTVNCILSVLNTLLKTAVDWKKLSAMPCQVRMLKVPPAKFAFYDFAQYADIVEAAGRLDWRIQAMVLLGGDAGLRMGEIIALEQTDVDHKRMSIHVQRSEWKGHVSAPKGGKDRRVPMTSQLAELLKVNRHLRGERLLYRDDGQTVTRNTLTSWLKRAQARANLKAGGALHILRHTFCSHLAMRGAAAKAIQELAGHENLTTTQRYMHLSPAAKDQAIALLNTRPTEARVDLSSAAGGAQQGHMALNA